MRGAHTPVDVDARKQACGVSPRCGRHPAQGARGRLQGRGRSWRTAGAAASVHAAAMIPTENRVQIRKFKKSHGPAGGQLRPASGNSTLVMLVVKLVEL
jgi:hypothetical protein